MSTRMSEFWKRKMRTYFKMWDVDRDGYVSEKDFAEIARGFAEAYNANDEIKENLIKTFVRVWRKFMKAGDIEKDGRLTLTILVESMEQQLRDPELILEFNHMTRTIYGLMDINQDGYLQPDEHHTLFRKFGVPEGTFDEKFAFDAIDVNGDGKLSIDEFVAAFFDFLFSQDESSPNKFFFGPLVD